ncbi:MAG: DUF58 domain-containing protein [Gammaproteobacteria bacterium]
MLQQPIKNTANLSSGTEVTLQELIALRNVALHQPLSNNKRLTLPGVKLTNIRGRGIEFDATREYQAGDDIRSMAWRVTARSLKPHIKVYREEKERPVWLAVDLSPSLYFGTRCMFKSIKSIMQASLTGWSSLLKHERIGAIISSDQKPLVFQPQSGEKYYLAILHALAESSRLQPVFNNANYLRQLLLALQQQIRTGNIIYIYSDFFHFDTDIEKLILHLAQRTQVILNFIYDPFEAIPPPPYQYLLTNGQQNLLFNMQDRKNREDYRQLFQMKVKQLQDFTRKHQMILRMYCTDPEREITI